MSQYKYAEIADTVYFWFAANLTTGAAGDGASPLYDVRLAGAAADAAPTASGTPTLLSHANYSDGLHEIAIDTTGYSAGEYAVFCTLTISTVNPAGFCGSFKLRTAGTGALGVNTTTITNGAITAAAIADNAIDLATFAADCKTGSALKANVETITNDAITAASINTGAFTADAFAADAIVAATLATGCLTADAFAADAIVAATLATGCLTADAFAANAIANAAVADDVDVNTKTITAGAIAAASFAAGAINAAAIADAAIDFATFAADCKTGTGLKANVESVSANAITATAIADGAIDAATFAAGAIDATAIAANAIDAATFAADVDAELRTIIWNAPTADYGGAGTYGQAVEDVLADTNELQGDWVNTGRLDTIVDTINTTTALCEDILRNKMEVTDANGNTVLYADDNSTPLYSVDACLTDNSTTTTRKRLA